MSWTRSVVLAIALFVSYFCVSFRDVRLLDMPSTELHSHVEIPAAPAIMQGAFSAGAGGARKDAVAYPVGQSVKASVGTTRAVVTL
jgi:hypothetical protein